MFETVTGRTTFKNDHVHIWKCPSCGGWRPVPEEYCSIDGTPRDASREPLPMLLNEPAD
jgi:hypothetical protein